ncbi:apolipoprotein N-acyltransferase [Roseateles toxinivorans]|uniref:Apolipoprotein N-acyltransferase n=1 Tax=Roseateles toxinivorans TaxID=270368 RepID=A0A4R6QKX4_9BURK|nr:apolipoprotein N-acyltransferase [Roseateles toxinivorans]
MLASALLCWLYARGGAGWLLGFVALVPWLRSLAMERSLATGLLSGWAMSVAYTAAVFAWFGSAIGSYTQIGGAAGLALMLMAAPLFQPQFLAFALVRYVVDRHHGSAVRALAGAAAWVATEWLVPRLLGDTLGYGLYPSQLLRQAADIGGATGLTVLLLLANECITVAIERRRNGARAVALPLAMAAGLPLLLAGYGFHALSQLPAEPTAAGKPLRMGLVQSNLADYERRRREQGAAAVVREVLDTHFAMSYDAVERQRADAVLWSETVYPTTFGQPKSEAGAEFDREILAIVSAAGVPFVFGTYDRDEAGEYNAAAFVTPDTGLLGLYRKTRPFPLTEYVPAWLDGPTLRRWLPWAGSWRPGTGARVFPLRLADGREIPVLPLICLDDVDAGLAIDGARLGAQAILTMSNDSWFTDHPRGAELHQAVAAFRSIETRLPQFRVTTNGYSAVIDASGSVITGARMGERTLVVGAMAVREAPRTLMVAWGDWVGRAAAVLLVLLASMAGARRWWTPGAEAEAGQTDAAVLSEVAVLPRSARIAAGLLRSFARGSLLCMVAVILLGDGTLQSNTLAQIRTVAALFLIPEAAAWCVLRAFAARVSIEPGRLVLQRGRRRLELPLRDIAAIEPWRLPIPGPGAWLRLASGQRWPHGLALGDPQALARALAADGGLRPQEIPPSRAALYARARLAIGHGRLAGPLAKFVLLPFALAVPAFRLHQHIAYGSSFGEYHSLGLLVFAKSFALWWAAWAIGVVLCAAVLRALIEAGTLCAVLLSPARAIEIRGWLERLGLAALYLGLPGWLLLRVGAG